MGVSITYRTLLANGGLSKEHELKIGWRSMAYELLGGANLIRMLDKSDSETLRELAKLQLIGECEPPFDWSADIAAAFNLLADKCEAGPVLLQAEW